MAAAAKPDLLTLHPAALASTMSWAIRLIAGSPRRPRLSMENGAKGYLFGCSLVYAHLFAASLCATTAPLVFLLCTAALLSFIIYCSLASYCTACGQKWWYNCPITRKPEICWAFGYAYGGGGGGGLLVDLNPKWCNHSRCSMWQKPMYTAVALRCMKCKGGQFSQKS
jgi:hypothetical protein